MRTSSSIVTAFTQANQNLELNQMKSQFNKLTQDIKDRRKKLIAKSGIKQEEKGVDASQAEKFKLMDEHRIELSELETRLQTNLVTGLTRDTAERKLNEIGKNVLSEKKRTPWYVKLLHEFTSFFAILLWVGGGLCLLAYGLDPSDPSNLYLGVVLIIIVFVTGIVTYFQNAKSESIMDAFKNFIPPETIVVRDGQNQKLDATCLVPGDIVIIEFGKRIPADIRILDVNGMKVDNSSLTGESLLLARSVECTNKENPLETKNLAFFGTLCKEGSGKGIVIFTGDRTVIGQIAGLASEASAGQTPLRREIDHFIFLIATVAFITGVIFFCLGFIIGYNAVTNLVFAIGIIVANVPEGLLATVTVALTLTAKRLAGRKVLVKNLEGVETLGSTSCICSDKTGTLTQNKMTVEHLWYNNTKYKGHNYQKMGPRFSYQYNKNESGFKQLHECAAVCTEANFDSSLPQDQVIKIQNNHAYTQQQKDAKLKEAKDLWEKNLSQIPWLERPTTGDASETALIKFFQPLEDINYTRSNHVVIRDAEQKPARMPFNSTNKYAFVIVEYETPDSHYCLFTKGAPERIWGLCDKVFSNEKVLQKDPQWEDDFLAINHSFGKEGERVLGFAKYHFPKNEYPIGYQFNIFNMNFPFNSQVFLGLISVIDPPKDAVPDAVIKCKTAGIQVIMVTGDQPVTAAAIARQCNIINEKTANEISEEEGIPFEVAIKMSNAVVIHGDRLTKMAIEEEGLPEGEKGRPLQEWLQKPQLVFARTSPAQKLIIVTGCQKLGHIVAVTGDGVNDSPAIKKADIGIAMGITGSDVAKDAADMILLNDDFSNIVIGIEEGRKIFDNLKKAVIYCVASNVQELTPYLGFVILQLPLPLSTVLVLCIDLGTDMVPSNGFVFEDGELDIMMRRPRNQLDHLVSGKMLTFAYLQLGIITSFGAYLQWFVILNDFGIPPIEVLFLNSKKGVAPKLNDVYDPQSPWLGHSILREKYIENGGFCKQDDGEFELVDWLFRLHYKYDLRMMIVYCGDDGRWHENVSWGKCNVNQVSPVSDRPICYSTEANKYGQTGFFFSIVWCQLCVFITCKTNKVSVLYQGMKNYFMYFGFTTELMLVIMLGYCLPLNFAFGTRDLIYQHFGFIATPYAVLLILWNEIRKYMILNYPSPKQDYPNWWERCSLY